MVIPLKLNWKTIITTHLVVFIQMTSIIVACPSDVCVCKWKGGKQSVECGGQLLSHIPEGMDPGTQVLNFSGNSLQVLQSERFLRMDLINLQKIYLSRNQLIKIHEKAFRGLSNLVELDLSDNMLSHIPSETFQDYTSLMRLSLSGNPIRELKTSAFRHLAFLTTLELSNCQIENIENEAFIGMDNLEWLRLDGNRIRFIQGNHILPKALHGISLHSNRWTCDCHLIDVHAWLINYNTPVLEEPKCIEPPRLKGQVIKTLKKDELACLPNISPKSYYTEISEGRNISLVCIVRAVPEAKVLWLFNGQILTNDSFIDNMHMYYYTDDSGSTASINAGTTTGTSTISSGFNDNINGEEKRSEIFIYNVGIEDNGTFSCVGINTAGTSFSNYTLRVLIKEPPVVKEVSFPKDYVNVIIASSGGFGFILFTLLCTIVIKCRRNTPNNKNPKGETAQNETGLLKCPSIINEEDMSPKMTVSKENGSILGNNVQIKQNCMMYVGTLPQGHVIDSGSMQINPNVCSPACDVNGSNNGNVSGGIVGNGIGSESGSIIGIQTQYCSPPSSVRNYQEKNPDLINDAESVKNKMKNDGSEYEGSDCSTGPCSMQSTFENCYQIAPPPQIAHYGSQIIRPTSTSHQRFSSMSTMPRGLHTIPAGSPGMSNTPAQHHQVDVHLNPVCFLGQDGFPYDYSNNHIHNSQNLPSAGQNSFYRTLPHNRGHGKLFSSAANPSARYSLEAEFLQRTGTPNYDKFVAPNVRFTAEGYPSGVSIPTPQSGQYPSPPEGYKGEYVTQGNNSSTGSQPIVNTSGATSNFQQWPPCLPGYHAQPVRYPPTFSQVMTNSVGQQSPTTSLPVQPKTSTTSTSTLTTEVRKRCVGAQTSELDASSLNLAAIGGSKTETIDECDEDQDSAKLRHLSGPLADSPDEGYVGDSQEGSDI